MKNNTNENLIASDTLDQTEIMPVPTPKNTWLYPVDAFGILEKGVTADSRIYLRAIEENETPVFTIIKR